MPGTSKRLGMTAKSPALRQAERRARGARAIMLPGPVVAQLDAVATYFADGTRAACLSRLIHEATHGKVEIP